jgi:hypothetical protein
MAGEMTKRLERCASRLGITVEDFMVFSALRCAEDLEALERVTSDHDILNQLRDVLDLRKLGVMTPEDFAREVEELLSMPADDEWTSCACGKCGKIITGGKGVNIAGDR